LQKFEIHPFCFIQGDAMDYGARRDQNIFEFPYWTFGKKKKGFENVSVKSSQRNNQYRAKIVKILLQCKMYTESQIDTKKLLWRMDLNNSCTVIKDKVFFFMW
jgi:hypothetical protein